MIWIFVSIAAYLYLFSKSIEAFSEPVFVSKEYMYKVVQDSSYFDNMTALDLVARGARAQKEYKERYIENITEFTSAEKAELAALADEIDRLRSTKRLTTLKWKFAKLGGAIENGFPHTLQDVIVLPESFFSTHDTRKQQLTTLVHEKVHVFQRIYPQEVKAFLDMHGFRGPVPPASLPDSLLQMRRNNPDIAGYYKKNNMIPLQVYNNTSPRSLQDSRVVLYDTSTREIKNSDATYTFPSYISQTEHPYEVMAVAVSLLYTGTTSDSMFATISQQWCDTYL